MNGRLNENPDSISAVHGKWNFQDKDAYTFIYRVQDELLFTAKTDKFASKGKMFHLDMVKLLATIGKIFRDESWYEYDEKTGDYGRDPNPIKTPEDLNRFCEFMGNDIYWDDAGGWIKWGMKSMQVYGDANKVIRYVLSIADIDDEEFDPDIRTKYSSIGVFGRYWEDTEVSSFWITKRDLGRLIAKGGLDGYFDYLGIDKGNARLNSADDTNAIFSVSDAVAASGEKPTMTRDQERELMMKQHLDPESKRKLNKDADQIDKYGGVLPAQYHAWSRTSDGIIKLGDLLKECPDGVYGNDGRLKNNAWYSDDAFAFFAFPMCCVIQHKNVHDRIWSALLQCYRQRNLDPILDPVNAEYNDIKFDIAPEKFLALLNPNAFIGKLLQRDLNGKIKDIRTDLPEVLSGRVWTDSKIISFWNDRSVVEKNWSNVPSMVGHFFGSLDDYAVDGCERDASIESGEQPPPMPSASDIGRNKNDELKTDGQINAIISVMKEPQILDKVDDELLKKIRQKMHVLDPQAKAQVMKAVGNITPHKAVEIANKLRMSVAEFNHIANVNESSILLKSLIPHN